MTKINGFDKIMFAIELTTLLHKIGYVDFIPEIPFLNFPFHWQVQIIPPYAGIVARFMVKTSKTEEKISVYLDQCNVLGSCIDENNNFVPYWEIYPNSNGNNSRFYLNETEELLKAIDESLKVLESKQTE